MKYDFVFVVLVYRNTKDLEEFFASLKLVNYRVIVVNSYYDEVSEIEFKSISEKYAADFISVPNNGYGAGNNRGVEFALSNYDFKYLVISNADVCVLNMDVKYLKNLEDGIYAPSIRTFSGKQQNPHMAFHCHMIDYVKNKCFIYNLWKIIVCLCAINKIFRLLFIYLIRFINNNRIYSAHGAFVILTKGVIEKLFPLYDEDVFLFTEEENLAMNAKRKGIPTYFVPSIRIFHKEDGSVSTISDRLWDITKDSYITFYKKWYS